MGLLVSIVQDALASVSSALPDAVREMRHGTETGDAIKTSSVEMSGEAATESGAVEKCRVIVKAADFPTLSSEALITLAYKPHVVTSLRTDPIGATLTVGLSETLEKCAAQVIGVRGSRPLRFPIGLLATCNGLATDFSDGYAPSSVYSWTLCISADEWPENEGPQIGDEIRFEKNVDQVVKVSRSSRRDGFFILNARSR